MRFKRPSVAAVALAFLAIAWSGSGVAEAGRCKRVRPEGGKICVTKCSRSQGMMQLKFSRFKPGIVLTIRVGGCVDFKVKIGEDKTAEFEINDLAELHHGYIIVIVPAYPNPKEYVPRIKCSG